MICYQDEKTYGGKTDMTLEEIDCEIERLEMELYGRTFLNDFEKKIERKPMIYDFDQHKLVERQQVKQ